jgi:predicted P-loop ATPase
MLNFSRGDDRVKLTLGKERLKSASEEFGKLEEADEEDAEWMKLLEVDKRGKCKPTIGNVVLILENDPNLKKKIALSEFSYRIMKTGSLPWHKLVNKTGGDIWQDSDDASLRHYIEKAYEISTPNRINDALSIVQEKNKYHPIRDYLKSLSWDGIKRVETLLIDYLGAEDSMYTKTVTRKMLAAAVARVFNPGIKFDYMLVLVGMQGLAKSQLIRLLGKYWYSDSVITIQGKEAFEQLQGVWILEMAELSATRKADVEHVKHYISKCEDSYRVAYGRHVAQFPRQCIFFGTTNENEFLRDKTGNRRFWPVLSSAKDVKIDVKKDVWKEFIPYEVDQVWAEAYEIWKNGEELFLRDEIEKEALIRQELHAESSMNQGIVTEYVNMLLPENWDTMDIGERRLYIHGGELGGKRPGVRVRERVCAMEVWCELMNGEAKELKNSTERELHDILRRIEGWKPYSQGTGKLRFKIYGVQKAYVRDEAYKE